MVDTLGEKIERVKKRDGGIVPFDSNKIARAIFRAMDNTKNVENEIKISPENDSARIAENVVTDLKNKAISRGEDYTPHIEDIQNLVERNLILSGFPETAKHYILYRHERAEIRSRKMKIPDRVKNLVEESKKYFQGNQLGEFVYYRTYSKWKEDEGRRETWVETVDRYMDFMKDTLESRLEEDEYNEVKHSILNMKAMPSMRLLWSAGKAAKSSNVAAYNCSYLPTEKIRDFSEMMYILMCGTGAGFSVENSAIQQLPIIKKQNGSGIIPYAIEDSKEGWAEALNLGLQSLFNGQPVSFDYSKLRPAGARLKTMGGRSSGPDALKDLLDYVGDKLEKKQGRRLSTLDVHDINCKIGEIVVVGGVRRSAEISLSDLFDYDMRNAKGGAFWNTHPERRMANNSAVYDERPSHIEFMKEWLSLAESGTGERGIFNRGGLKHQLPKRRLNALDGYMDKMGTNPCGEIILRPRQFCNLTEAVARTDDTKESLMNKIKVATILGTYQSMLTDFRYLSQEWKENCEEERLLGVSITGIMDAPVLKDTKVLRELRDYAVEVNKHYAGIFGINQSTAITCVKPSGTVSQLVNSSSGAHPRWSPEYIRHIRISANDPLFQMIKDQKYPYYPETGQSIGAATTYVLPFPVRSPENSTFRRDLDTITQLEDWKRLKVNFTEHNPSVSIYVGDNEWIDAAKWIYENWDVVGGLAFFPRKEHIYPLAPYVELDEEKYRRMMSNIPKIDYSQIFLYERDDKTSGAREYACVSGACEI